VPGVPGVQAPTGGSLAPGPESPLSNLNPFGSPRLSNGLLQLLLGGLR